MKPFPIFIGYDSRETVAAHVLAHSLIQRSSVPLSINLLRLNQLGRAGFVREIQPDQSTEFAFSRFMVPALCDYEGFAIFMDCDMLCLSDPAELIELVSNPNYAVSVVKHNYTPKQRYKFLGHEQFVYQRKNWSSVMGFNCARCKALTVDAVNSQTGMWLHRFAWLEDQEIGSLPLTWNHLVDEYPRKHDAKLVHFTNGGPWFKEYFWVEFSNEWRDEYRSMSYAVKRRPNG